jgi:hypothetical protein
MKKYLAILLVLHCILVRAQDNNYWNHMPGSVSSLMGGAAAGVRDNSAIYYNPGSFGFVDSITISVSAVSYQMELGSILNAGGPGVDMKSVDYQTVPLVSVSGIIKPKKHSKSTLGYMMFTSNETSNGFSYRYDGLKNNKIFNNDSFALGFDNYFDAKNAPVEFIGDYNMQSALNEMVVGGCYAYQVDSNLSVGISPFFAYRYQNLTQSYLAKAFPDTGSNFFNNTNNIQISSVGFDDIEYLDYYNIRTFFKIGMALDFNKLKIGATFTTPSINLGGGATIARDISYYGGYANFPQAVSTLYPFSYVYNARQNNINTVYNSPSSLNIGIEYTYLNTTVAVSLEYFGKVEAYNLAVPDSASFQRPIWQNRNSGKGGFGEISANEYLQVTEAAKTVTNFAIAIKQQINKKIAGILSFRTDYSSYVKTVNDFWEYLYVDQSHPAGQHLSFSDINLYHFNIGAVYKKKKSDMNIGLSLAFGSNKHFQSLVNIANPSDNSNVLGAIPNYSQPATYNYSSYSLLMGYTYHLK